MKKKMWKRITALVVCMALIVCGLKYMPEDSKVYAEEEAACISIKTVEEARAGEIVTIEVVANKDVIWNACDLNLNLNSEKLVTETESLKAIPGNYNAGNSNGKEWCAWNESAYKGMWAANYQEDNADWGPYCYHVGLAGVSANDPNFALIKKGTTLLSLKAEAKVDLKAGDVIATCTLPGGYTDSRYESRQDVGLSVDCMVEKGEEWEYTENNGSITITKYTGSDEIVTVPAELDGKKVYKIGSHAFSSNETVKEIIVSEGIQNIGYEAIYACSALSKITLPKSLLNMSELFFCNSLKEINVEEGNSCYKSIDGLLCDATGTELIKCPSGRESVTVPKGITKIQNSAFGGISLNTTLKEVIIPEGVTSIGSRAFWNCEKLSKVVLPDSISSIDREAFEGCRSLKEIILPAGLKSIEYRLFCDCVSLEKVVLPANLETIESEAFLYCSSLSEITIPASVTDIKKPAFSFCSNLKVINVEHGSGSYQSADGVLYDADGKKLIRCPEGKTSVAIMDSVTAIESYAFSLCTGLNEIMLPAHLRIIKAWAFLDCESLHKITIPAGVADIGYQALGYIDPKSYGEEYKKVKDFVITGYADTAAELYAKENEMSFQSLGNRPDVLSAEKMLQLAEENATQETLIETPNGVTFTFEKDSMNLIDGKTSYDFGSKISEDYSNLVNPSFAKDEFAFQIDYNYEGQLPGEAKISIPVESKWIGKRLYYYEIDADGGYTYMGRSTVAEDGTYTVKQDHCSSYVAVTKVPEKLGDCDGEEGVNAKDALAVLKYSVGIPQEHFVPELADCDGEDGVNAKDALAILKFSVGIITEFE